VDGRIDEEWSGEDWLDMLQQLGAFPCGETAKGSSSWIISESAR
jgi:hypothetical protein